MNKKRLLAFVLSMLMVVGSLAGCGSNKTVSEDAGLDETATTSEKTALEGGEKQKDEEVTLSLLLDNSTSLAGIEAVAKLAKEKLGIILDIETAIGGSEGDNIIKTRLASGEMSDILGYNSGSLLKALNPSEYFVDISGESFAERLDETYRGTVTVDGATYGIPITSSQAGGILYSKSMYEEYGLEIPRTWDDFIKNCAVLKEAGETALIGSFADSWTAQVLFLGDNYNVLAKEPNFAEEFETGKAKYATTEAGLASFAKMAETHKYYNSDYLATTYDDACDMLANGEGGHWIMLTQALTNIHQLYADKVNDIGVFGVPGNDAGDNGLTVWMPLSLYANKNSDKKEDILRFMEFYISDEALDAYSSAILPDGPYCIKGYELPENAYPAVANDMQAYFDKGKTTVALEFLTVVKGPNCDLISQAVASGQITAEQAAKEYDDDCLKQAVQMGLDWE